MNPNLELKWMQSILFLNKRLKKTHQLEQYTKERILILVMWSSQHRFDIVSNVGFQTKYYPNENLHKVYVEVKSRKV